MGFEHILKQLTVLTYLLLYTHTHTHTQRLGRLVREGRFVEALQLGLELYEGKAHAVVGECMHVCTSQGCHVISLFIHQGFLAVLKGRGSK